MEKLIKERVPMAEHALVNKINELVFEVNKLKKKAQVQQSTYNRAINYTKSIFNKK